MTLYYLRYRVKTTNRENVGHWDSMLGRALFLISWSDCIDVLAQWMEAER